jgi:hypothetical protein
MRCACSVMSSNDRWPSCAMNTGGQLCRSRLLEGGAVPVMKVGPLRKKPGSTASARSRNSCTASLSTFPVPAAGHWRWAQGREARLLTLDAQRWPAGCQDLYAPTTREQGSSQTTGTREDVLTVVEEDEQVRWTGVLDGALLHQKTRPPDDSECARRTNRSFALERSVDCLPGGAALSARPRANQ